MNAFVSRFFPSPGLNDKFGRTVDYLRISITDRCNLRCHYCMPEEGVKFLPHEEILSYEELVRLSTIFQRLGVKKIRITGGEPFVRPDCATFMQQLMAENPELDLRVTSNGVVILPHLGLMKEIGLKGLNLSLDAMDSERFTQITGKDKFAEVLASFHRALKLGLNLKVNTVVQAKTEDTEIVKIAELAKQYPIDLRFIEHMPFNGKAVNCAESKEPLEQRLLRLFPELTEVSSRKIATARKFSASNFIGTLGLIEGESRKFCGHCNKVRLTSVGMLKNCLYDQGVLDLREMLRSGASDVEIAVAIKSAVAGKLKNGHEVAKQENQSYGHSMATIGG